MNINSKIVIPGAAGLVGQNLIIQLKNKGFKNIVAIDKHHQNSKILSQLHPDIMFVDADLSCNPREWAHLFKDAACVIMLQAQIGAPSWEPFFKNTIKSSEYIIEAMKKYNTPYLIHVSSSVVNSVAKDFYTDSKKTQEAIVVNSGIPYCILRPTLMFGWFDRKHLGWLSRFMRKTPIFPIPGHGQYMRQPLYEKDFCKIIISAMSKRIENKIFDITGRDEIDYIDIIKLIKKVNNLKTLVVKIPYWLFYLLLEVYSTFSKNPPFTTQQLEALIADDSFELISWWEIFDITPTNFEDAMYETFNDPVYSKYSLKF